MHIQLVEVVSPAAVLNKEKQNKLAQLMYKTYMSYSETEVKQSQKEFQTCFMKVSKSTYDIGSVITRSYSVFKLAIYI